MNLEETKKYIERRLSDLGWSVRIDKNGFQTIQKYSGGDKERLNHLYYKMVSVGSRQDKREINGETIQVAIEDLKRMDEIVENAPLNLGQNNRHDFDRVTIEQLASSLEEKVAAEIESAVAHAGKQAEAQVQETKAGGNGQHHPAGTAAAAAAFPAKDGASRKPRILVVDDSPTIRAAVTKALENDFEFVEASDGERAWKLLRANTDVKLVVTDLMMPKMDGYDLIKRIRTNKSDPWIANLPIIVVTALEDTQAKLRALVAGANDFITKNTDTLELQARVMARYQLAQAVSAERNNSAAAVVSSVTDVGPPPRQAAATLLGHKGGPTIAKQAIRMESVGKPLSAVPSKATAAVTSIQIPPRNGLHPVGADRGGDENIFNRVVATAVAGYRRLEQLDPTTGITLLASFLVVVTIAGVLYVNRSAPRTAAGDVADNVVSTDAAAEKNAAAGVLASDGKLAVNGREANDVEMVRNGASSTAVDRTWEHEKAATSSSQTAKRDPVKAAPAVAAETAAKPAVPAPTAKSTAVAAAGVKSETKPEPKPEASPEPPSVAAARQESQGAGSPPVASEPEPPITVAQAAPRPVLSASRLSQAELTALVKKFVFVYQAGDIESFLSLFDDSIRTNDRSNKAGLREDYESLFKSTTLRQMVVGDVAWEVDDKQARGWSNFEVRIRNQGEDELKTYRGSLTFHVEKIDGRPKIVRLYHGQWKAN
jgi:CheY-like chemotaxis protein